MLFMAMKPFNTFAQIVNMQETKSQIINHIRIMIEEVEHPNEKVKASCEICALYSA